MSAMRANLRNPVTPWDHIQAYRRELTEMDERALRALQAAYYRSTGQMYEELQLITRKIEQALRDGTPVHPSWLWRQERWQSLMHQASESMHHYGIEARSIIEAHEMASGIKGAKDAAGLLQVVSPGTTFNMLPIEAVEMMVANLRIQAPAGQLLNEIAQTAPRMLRETIMYDLENELVGGIALGRNPRDVARRIHKRVGDKVENLSYHRAETIARTESLRMYRAAANENYRANSNVVKGWVWVSELNQNTCAGCLGMHMTTHPVDKNLESHVGCRCAAMPFVDDERPDLPFGDDWLRDQPESVQRRILDSPTRYQLWKDGKITLADCVEEGRHRVWGGTIGTRRIRDLKRVAAGELPSKPNPVWNPLGDPVVTPTPTPTPAA